SQPPCRPPARCRASSRLPHRKIVFRRACHVCQFGSTGGKSPSSPRSADWSTAGTSLESRRRSCRQGSECGSTRPTESLETCGQGGDGRQRWCPGTGHSCPGYLGCACEAQGTMSRSPFATPAVVGGGLRASCFHGRSGSTS